MPSSKLTTIEICAGAGGQALGLEFAGFQHAAAIEIDADACDTLRANRRAWDVQQMDVHDVDGRLYKGVDLLAGGVPCPPFSIAGKQLGGEDERDLFPQAVRLTQEIKPRAVMLENVRGFSTPRFAAYRRALAARLDRLGYEVHWQVLNAVDFGVPQNRPRFVLVALRRDDSAFFAWPSPGLEGPSVGDSLADLMGEHDWPGLGEWIKKANRAAPTIVGGSKKHGGPDLGPTRARADWRKLGVDGRSLAERAPDANFPINGLPRLTVRMVARLQGFPDEWIFAGKKTSSYRQVGNAFPSPVAMAVGLSIHAAFARVEPQIPTQPALAAS